jgi:UDP-N-acetylglucosamine--N-acetylmuramyl-(pentapeptide) pyrophosphoryl-undecaprenol N-acetylglucosamine transferase
MLSLKRLGVTENYNIKAYLEGEELASAMFGCELAICRSGAGTLSEIAAFRKPTILVPYPHSFAQHQLYNAKEFADMGAAQIVNQVDLQPAMIEEQIKSWLKDRSRVAKAQTALEKWDVPDSAMQILGILEKAVNKGPR